MGSSYYQDDEINDDVRVSLMATEAGGSLEIYMVEPWGQWFCYKKANGKYIEYDFLPGQARREIGNPAVLDKIKEGQIVTVASGGTLRFTALAAGCLAVTACFQAGGGVGMHMALALPKEKLWSRFLKAIEGKTISRVYLDSDMVGQDDGWLVKYSYNEDTYAFAPDPSVGPQSATDLGLVSEGWMNTQARVVDWFKAALGTQNVALNQTNGAVERVCP